MAAPLTITTDNFEKEVLQSSSPVLVDFWAPWCGPCRVIGPVVEEFATQYAGKLKVGKLNVDDHGAVAQRYGILAFPPCCFSARARSLIRSLVLYPRRSCRSILIVWLVHSTCTMARYGRGK